MNNYIKTITNLLKAIYPFVVAFFLRRGAKKGKDAEYMEKEIKAIREAKKSRDSLNNPERVNSLHEKYKR